MDVLGELASAARGQWTSWVFAAIGAAAMAGWTRFRGRMVRLRWNASHAPVASHGATALTASIQVLYNGNPAPDLHVTTVEIVNDSSTDLGPVTVILTAAPGAMILQNEGGVVGAALNSPWSEAFAAEWRRVTEMPGDQRPAERIDFLLRNRCLAVQSLNRRGRLRYVLLTSFPAGVPRHVMVTCEEKGVLTLESSSADQFLGVERSLAGWVGIVVCGALVAAVNASSLPPWSVVTIAFLLGVFVLVPGAGVVTAWRWLRARLD